MNRRTFLLGSTLGGIAGAPRYVRGEQGAKAARVAVLSPGPRPAFPSPEFDSFREGLRELGYVEGQNLAIEWRFAGGDDKRLAELASELVRLNVAVILPINAPAAQAAETATAKIPIVFVQVGDTAASGIQSLARPGGNVTGLVSISRELSGKRLEILKEASPRTTNIGVLRHTNPTAERIFRDMEEASRQLGLRLLDLAIRGRDELRRTIEDGIAHHVAALVVIDGATIASLRPTIIELARGKRLPVISQFREFVVAGGLMAYGPSLREMYRRAATYVDKILKGTRPADLPVEQPTTFELVINLKTAKALALTIPQSLLARADEVIQ